MCSVTEIVYRNRSKEVELRYFNNLILTYIVTTHTMPVTNTVEYEDFFFWSFRQLVLLKATAVQWDVSLTP
jgi:hypothetical protein